MLLASLFALLVTAQETRIDEEVLREVERVKWDDTKDACKRLKKIGVKRALPALVDDFLEEDPEDCFLLVRGMRAVAGKAESKHDEFFEEAAARIEGVVQDERAEGGKRLLAAVALGVFGNPGRARLPILLSELERGDFEDGDLGCALALCTLDRWSVPDLAREVESGAYPRAACALVALDTMGRDAVEAAPELNALRRRSQ